jgi:hypothetical protein
MFEISDATLAAAAAPGKDFPPPKTAASVSAFR